MIPQKIKSKLWALTRKMYGSEIEHTSYKPEKDIEDHEFYYRVWFNDKKDKSTHICKISKKDLKKYG